MADTNNVPHLVDGKNVTHQSTIPNRDSISTKRKSSVGKSIGKPEISKKATKEKAAHMEHLLAARNATYVLNYLEKKTHFDKEQIRALQRIYRRFKGSSPMDRLRFREMVASVLGITDNIMLDRIFQAFDGDNEGSVSENEWIIGLSVQFRGTLDQQIAYSYDVYDVNGDRSIGRDEISSFYRNSIYAMKGIMEPEEVDDAVNELVELAMKKFDINKDGNIKFSEYRHIVRKDPLLLEAFGECLPKERAAVPLMALLDPNERSYNCYLSTPGDSSWRVERDRYVKFSNDHLHSGYTYDHAADEFTSDSPSSWSTAAQKPQHTTSSNVFQSSQASSVSGMKKHGFKPKTKNR